MKRQRRFTSVATMLAAATLVGMAACDTVDLVGNVFDDIVVVTHRDPDFDFGAAQTFTLPDSVVHLTSPTGVPLAVSREFDAVILQSLRENMVARGYTEVADVANEQADLILLPAVSASEQFESWVSFNWFGTWGFFPGFFFDDFNSNWGLFFPWASTVGVETFERGTLLVQMLGTAETDPTAQTVRVVWAGAAIGILNPNRTFALGSARIDAAIDEMFFQSPYIQADLLQ